MKQFSKVTSHGLIWENKTYKLKRSNELLTRVSNLCHSLTCCKRTTLRIEQPPSRRYYYIFKAH